MEENKRPLSDVINLDDEEDGTVVPIPKRARRTVVESSELTSTMKHLETSSQMLQALVQQQLPQLESQLKQERIDIDEERVALEREQEMFTKEKQEYADGIKWFDAVVEQMNTVKQQTASKIVLDIGGSRYTTIVDTLTRESNTFFSALLSEYGNWQPDKDGTYFIDRDGTHFNIILNHLRGSDVSQEIRELSDREKKQLHEEVKFYMIHSMNDYFVYNQENIVSTDLYEIIVWDIPTARVIQTMEHGKEVQDLIRLSNNRIATCSLDSNCIRIWDIATGKSLKSLNDDAWCLLKLNNDRIVSGGSYDGTIKIWNIESNKCLVSLYHSKEYIHCLAKLSEDVIASFDTLSIKIWSIATKKCLRTFIDMGKVTEIFGVSSDTLWIGFEDGSIKIYNVNTGTHLHTLTVHTSDVKCLFKISDNLIASGSEDCTAKIWDITTMQCTQTFIGDSRVNRIAKYSDSQIIICYRTSIKIWDLITGRCLRTISERNVNIQNGLRIA
jgi:WD40 repeat protein